MKKNFTVRHGLTLFLLLAVLFASFATYYKIKHWGFSYKPSEKTDIWNVDARVTFTPTGKPIEVSLSTPSLSSEHKVLSEDVVAEGYEVKADEENRRIIMTSIPRHVKQNLYYRVKIYDNKDALGKVKDKAPKKPEKPIFENPQQEAMVAEIWQLADAKGKGSSAQHIIELLNEDLLDPSVDSFLPVKKTKKILAEKIMTLLAARGISSRIVRGVKLDERKKLAPADLMIEVYEGSKWMIYNIETGALGLPKNFVVFQRGGNSLLDVSGGTDSQIRFSVTKSVISSFKMAENRAKYEKNSLFDYTIYNLPSLEQNALKWLMIFPLGILLVVLLRNVVGIQTMGTFTPMLISMSLVKTGFVSGFICFSIIVLLGLLLRTMLTKLNLLLVPRISAVVIFVIVIMQSLTIFGYQTEFKTIASAAFFPIIITAWIIERACITWEEEGMRNALRQIVNTLFVAVITYLIISSSYIRHIMFAFNEWNLVILALVMLLGTYTGYRLSELKRFAPLIKEK